MFNLGASLGHRQTPCQQPTTAAAWLLVVIHSPFAFLWLHHNLRSLVFVDRFRSSPWSAPHLTRFSSQQHLSHPPLMHQRIAPSPLLSCYNNSGIRSKLTSRMLIRSHPAMNAAACLPELRKGRVRAGRARVDIVVVSRFISIADLYILLYGVGWLGTLLGLDPSPPMVVHCLLLAAVRYRRSVHVGIGETVDESGVTRREMGSQIHTASGGLLAGGIIESSESVRKMSHCCVRFCCYQFGRTVIWSNNVC